MCPTYANGTNEKKNWTFTTTSQTKPKQKFVSIVLSMWLTYVSENYNKYFWTFTTTSQIKAK